MKINKLEQAVLRLLFKSEDFGDVSIGLKQVEVLKRDSTGSGFITWLAPHDLRIIKGPLDFTGGRVGGKINGTIEVGFLIYIKNGYVEALEGYTYEEEWPKEINSFELNLVDFSG